MTVFDARKSAPLGAPPVAGEGPNHDAYLLATNATEGFRDAAEAIRLDPDLVGDTERAKALGKEQGSRAAKLQDAKRRLEGEGEELEALLHDQRAFAGLVSPAEDAVTEMRAAAIRSQFAAMSPSDRLQAAKSGSDEVARALYFAPDMGGTPLLDPKLRAAITERLLSGNNPERHEAIAIRVEDHRRARFAVERALGFIGRGAGIRERLAAQNKGK